MDLAAILNGVVRVVEAFNSSDSSSLDAMIRSKMRGTKKSEA